MKIKEYFKTASLKTIYHMLQIVGVIVGIGVGVITVMSYLDKSDNFFDTADDSDVTVHRSITTETWTSGDGEMPDDVKAMMEDAKALIEQLQDEK